MDVKNTQQNINVNSTQNINNSSVNKSSDTKFADELKNVEKDKETKIQDTAKDIEDKNIETKEETKEKPAEESAKISDKADNEPEQKISKENDIQDKNKSVDDALDGLQDVVNEINKIGQKDELNNNQIKQDFDSADKNNKISNEENILIDNNMNIKEPSDKLNLQTETNTNFNNNEQQFSEFFNQNKSNNNLPSNEKELAEEKAILSTMEENIAIANKNMLLKQKAMEEAQAQEKIQPETNTEAKIKTIQDDTGIKKVDRKTNIIVDTIVSYNSVVMDKADVDFFVNLVENGTVNLNEVQNADKSSQVSKTLADLLAKAMNENKPVRIDFDNDISVIIKIDRAGKISADFLPSSQVAEAYLKENLPLLKQRFDENNIDYNELNQRKQKQNSQDNRKKGRKNE